MCGIAGIFSPDSISSNERITQKMVGALAHRGSDDAGVWSEQENGISFGHKRLAVVDLSAAGHQPMQSNCGRYVISYNGEIYNHLELRKDLEKSFSSGSSQIQKNELINWKGHSDTETLLAAFVEWGIEETLHHCVGMFAFAVWDRQTKQLYMARDRIGEKPLYYGWCNKSFVFASELKAFWKYPDFNNKIDRDVLALYFRYSYIPTPYSIYQGIYKLEPGCLLTIDREGVKSSFKSVPVSPLTQCGFSISRWWSFEQVAETGQSKLITNEQDGLMQLESSLRDSIRLQSIADVPLGAFLSGGVDSSLIVALMQTQNDIPVKTFTIGFKEQGYDEAMYAKAVANHLGTDHTEFYVSPEAARAVIPDLPTLYDEPFADSSQIPTHLISKLAHQHVTVALTGDAGDELFGGYNRYVWSNKIWRKVCWMPRVFRDFFLSAVTLLPVKRWDSLYHVISNIRPGGKEIDLFGDKLYKLVDKLAGTGDLNNFYYHLVSEWKNPMDLVIGAIEPENLISKRDDWPSFSNHEHLMMYLDSMTYLPDDILCKVDRAAMGVSLETRVPFLDHRVLEMAWQLPLNMKIHQEQSKWALRQLLYKYVPMEMIERPKQGFGIPLGQWLRGPLRDWAENLINPLRLTQEGYLHPESIQKKWTEHLSGKRNWEHQLWSVLMFQTWLESQQGMN